MLAAGTEPALASNIFGDTARSSFERTVLPGFAEWFVEEIRRIDPEIIVPMETKGARLLEAAIDFANEHFAVEFQVPVLYTPALAYFSPDELADKRVVLLDDATRSGRTLARHKRCVERYGASDVELLACVGQAPLVSNDRRGVGGRVLRASVNCYIEVNDERYREHLWQLAELIATRGLPPEVDHHVYRLDLPGRLVHSWSQLSDVLQEFGTLSIDGPLTADEDIFSMTLHYPEFPNAPGYPVDGPVRDEGVKKIRFFADVANDVLHVVPMAFPALTLEADQNVVPKAECEALLNGWTRGRESVGSLLVAQARTYDAETLFRIMSTATEVDLIAGLAQVVGNRFSGQGSTEFTSDRSLFEKLYGKVVATQVADYVDNTLSRVLTEGRSNSGGEDLEERLRHNSVRFDTDVWSGTRRIASYLKSRYEARAAEPDFDPIERVGLSLSELVRNAPPRGMDPLLLSRCIDFGLAMTTLVPYTDVRHRSDGSIEVRRRYRVSEFNRSDHDFQDLETVRQEIAEECAALISRYLRRHASESVANSEVSHLMVARLVAILSPNVLAKRQIALSTTPGSSGPELLFGQAQRKTVFEVISEHFRLVGNEIVPTETFDQRYESDDLRLDFRDDAEFIEEHLKALVSLPPEAVHEDEFLCWAMCVDGRLGLNYVDTFLRQALDLLDRPLTQFARGDRPDAAELRSAVEGARQVLESGRDVLEKLSADWSSAMRQSWPDPTKVERRLTNSMAAPADADLVYRLAHCVCSSVARIADQTERLIAWIDNDASDDVASSIADESVRIARELTTERNEEELPPISSDQAVDEVARMLKQTGRRIRSYSSALSRTYRITPNPRGESADGPRLRTVLFADMAGSTARALESGQDVSRRWKSNGLNMIAQWGAAFGGRETKDRAGDDIFLEFEDADSALLCAATIQQHAKALRSTNVAELDWQFRIAIDSDELVTSDGNNVISSGIDIAAKLCKQFKEDADSTERVLLTPRAQAKLSSSLTSGGLIDRISQELDLSAGSALAESNSRARFRPYKAHSAGLLKHLVSRLEGAVVKPTS